MLKRDRFVVVGIVLVAALLRFPTLSLQSFWADEYITVELLGLSFGDLLAAIPSREGTPPLYYVVAFAWTKLFGISETGLRSLSALAGTATVLVAYAAATRLGGSRRAGHLAAALVAVNPLLVWYSQEARSYSLLVFLTASSFLLLVRNLDEPRTGTLAGWGLLSALALATHYFAAFVVIPEAILLLVALRGRRRAVLLAATPIALVAAGALPLALSQGEQTAWIAWLDLSARLGEVPVQFLVGFTAPDERLWVGVAGAVVVVAALLLARANFRERRGAAVAAAIGATAAALPVLAVVAGEDYLITRNVIGALVPLMVALAIALATQRARRVGLVGAAVLCTLGASAVVASSTDPRLQRPDWQAVTEALEPADEGRLVLADGSYKASPLLHYLPGSRELTLGDQVTVSEIAFLAYDDPSEGSGCWSGVACNMPSTPQVPGRIADGFELVERRPVGRFTVLRFRSEAPVSIHPGEVVTALEFVAGIESRMYFQPGMSGGLRSRFVLPWHHSVRFGGWRS